MYRGRIVLFFVWTAFAALAGCTSGASGTGSEPIPHILMVIADRDFYDPEYSMPKMELEDLGYRVSTASANGGTATGLEGLKVATDLRLTDARAEDYGSILLVGGYGAESFYGNQDLIRLVRDFLAQGKPIGAQCFAPVVLAEAGLLDGAVATCWGTQGELLASYGPEYTRNLVEIHEDIVTGVSGLPQNIRAFLDAYLGILSPPKSRPLAASGVSPGVSGESPFEISPDGGSFRVRHAGRERTGLIYLPQGLDRGQQVSLIIGVHGMNSRGSEFQHTGFKDSARKFNNVLVFPDGLGGQWEVNAGSEGPNDDLGFFRRLMTELPEVLGLENPRVYLTGHSMGGMMIYRVAYELSPLIDAIAPVAGVFVVPARGFEAETEALPVLHLHAADDTVVPLRGFPGYSYSVDAGLEFWRSLGGQEVLLEVSPKGGHAWLPGAADRIADFFYNHPDRGGRLVAVLEAPGRIVHSLAPLMVSSSYSGTRPVTHLELMRGQSVLASAAVGSLDLIFEPEPYSYQRLDLRAEVGGRSILSSNSLELIVVPENLAVGAAAISSDDESEELAASYAVDGDLATRWSSGQTDSQFLELDLGQERDVSAITLVWEAAYGREYRLLGSRDAVRWEVLVDQTNGDGGTEIHRFNEQTLRHIRFEGRKRATNWRFSLWELMVHGDFLR